MSGHIEVGVEPITIRFDQLHFRASRLPDRGPSLLRENAGIRLNFRSSFSVCLKLYNALTGKKSRLSGHFQSPDWLTSVISLFNSTGSTVFFVCALIWRRKKMPEVHWSWSPPLPFNDFGTKSLKRTRPLRHPTYYYNVRRNTLL